MALRPAMVSMTIIVTLTIFIAMTMIKGGEAIAVTTIIVGTTTYDARNIISITMTPVAGKISAVVTIIDVATMLIVATMAVAGMSTVVRTTSTTSLRPFHEG